MVGYGKAWEAWWDSQGAVHVIERDMGKGQCEG